jgi:Na+/phosphate symporter
MATPEVIIIITAILRSMKTKIEFRNCVLEVHYIGTKESIVLESVAEEFERLGSAMSEMLESAYISAKKIMELNEVRCPE